MPLPMEESAPVSVPARVFTITASSLEVPRSDSADSSVPGGPDSPLSESHPFSPSSPFSPQTHRNSDGPVTLGLSIGRRAMLSEETPPQFTRSLSDPDTPGHDAHPFRTLSADCSDSSQISVSTRASSVAVSPRSSLNSPLPSALPSPTVDVGSLMVSPSKRPSFQYSDSDSRPPSSTELTALYDIPSSGRYFEPITESPQHSRNSSITSLLDEATQLPAKSSDDVNKYDATSFTAFLRTVALPLALLIASVFRHWGQAIMHFVFVGDYNPELHSHIDTPYFLKKNPYILNHYRVHYSKRNCVRSMCRCHNETANIFSHTVGFALCALLYYTNSEWLASIPHSAGDHFAFTLFFVSALYCMGASTFFHTFGCHSLKTYQFWLAQDIGGTFFMVLILMYMIIYFLFFDSTFWTVVYGVAFALPIFIFVPRIVEKSMLNKKNAELGQKCSEPEVGAKLDKNAIAYGKNGAAIGLSCVGLLVLLFLHVMARRGMYNPHLNGAIHYLSRHVFTCFSAVVVYLTRFPESILPGKFDLLLNSHNLWHVHGVVSLVYQYNLLVELFMYKQSFSN